MTLPKERDMVWLCDLLRELVTEGRISLNDARWMIANAGATPPEGCDHDWQPTFWRASYCPKCGWFLDHADGSLIPPKDKPDEQ